MTVKTYAGSCHCGKVRYEVDLDLASGTGRCNCSFCKKVRNWSILTKPEAFRLLSGETDLSSYRFGTKQGEHLFCKHCGVRTISRGHVEELGGDFVSIAVSSLDNVSDKELAELPVQYADGLNNNWMNAPAETRHL